MSMKYDAGMTQYHDDIVSALQDMLHGEIDKIAELAAEGSPVPLREYLRNNHGKAFHGGNRFDAMSSCFLVIFDHVINNEGDSKLNLSWSQVATFIRKYPSDFFKKNEDKEAFPCDGCGYDEHGCCNYPDTPDDYCVMGNKKLSLGIDELDLDVRTFTAFKRAGINTVEDYLNYPDKDKLRSVVGSRNFEKFMEASKPSELPTVQPERAAEIADFDYSELDADTAAKLESVTAEIFNVRKDYIFTMAKKVAYAHELLANHYGGKFGAWCESVGISRDTGNNLVRVAEIFGNLTADEQKNLSQVKPSLLYEAAKPSAPPELVEQVKSGDITTHKEYIELKKQLDEAKEKAAFWNKANTATNEENQKLRAERVNAMNRADNAERELSEAQAEIEKLNREADEADREYDAMADRECHYETEICKLEQRIKELENKPVDVAVPDEEEIERLSLEKSKGLLRAKDMECDRRLREMQDESRGKDKEISELKERLITIGENSEQIENFFEDMYNDAYRALKRCFEFVSESSFTPQTVNKLRLRLNSFSGVVNDFIEEMQQ